MFSLFQSEKMAPFFENIASFPTSIYTVLFLVCIALWIGALLGFLDLDAVEIDIDADIDIDTDISGQGESALSALLMRYGLVGVPMIITISILVIIGWLISYYIVYFLVPFEAGSIFRYIVGLPVFLGSLYLSAKITSLVIKPLKPFFKGTTQRTDKLVLGQTAIVSTLRVDNNFGEALLDDGGAGLIMNVRTRGDDRFERGDKVVIFEKLNDENIYRVISEEEFKLT